MSRSAVGRSIKRLVDAGIVRRVPRQARNGAQISTAFILPSRPANGTPPTHQRDTYKEESSHSLQYPDGKPSEQIDVMEPRKHQTRSKVDWSEVEEWLWVQVNYEKLYSDASRSDAEIELRHLRKHIGDFALARAVENAKKFKLYGTPLLDFLKNTKPDRTVTGEEGET